MSGPIDASPSLVGVQKVVRGFATGAGLVLGLMAALLGRPWLGAAVAVGVPAGVYASSAAPHRLLYLAVFLMPLDLYRVDLPVPVSLYRLTMVILAVSVASRLLLGRFNVRRGAIYGVVALFLSSTLMAFGRADDYAQATGVLLNVVTGLTLVLVAYHVLDTRQRVRRAVYWLVVSHVFTALFAAYAWTQFAVFGVAINKLPLGEFLPVPLAGPGHLATKPSVGSLPRLALPYTSPPALSLSLAISLVLGLSFGMFRASGRGSSGERSRVSVLWLPVMLILLLGTLSRSGGIAFVAGLIWMLVVLGKLRLRYVGYLVACAGLLGLVVAFLFPTEAIINRLQAPESTRIHLQTRLEALRIFSHNAGTVIFGVGLNSYQEYSASGGPHSHSPFTTVLAERGIVGWLAFWPLYLYLWLATWWMARAEKDLWWRSAKAGVSGAVFALLVGSLLYEFILIHHAWLAVALAAATIGVDRRQKMMVTNWR